MIKNFSTISEQAVRKFNLILDKIPMELKKDRKILMSEEASDIMYVLLLSPMLPGRLLVLKITSLSWPCLLHFLRIKMACQISEGGGEFIFSVVISNFSIQITCRWQQYATPSCLYQITTIRQPWLRRCAEWPLLSNGRIWPVTGSQWSTWSLPLLKFKILSLRR